MKRNIKIVCVCSMCRWICRLRAYMVQWHTMLLRRRAHTQSTLRIYTCTHYVSPSLNLSTVCMIWFPVLSSIVTRIQSQRSYWRKLSRLMLLHKRYTHSCNTWKGFFFIFLWFEVHKITNFAAADSQNYRPQEIGLFCNYFNCLTKSQNHAKDVRQCPMDIQHVIAARYIWCTRI